MIQLTERDGKAFPLAFDWEDGDGARARVKIDKVFSCTPCAEQKSGVVGDRYECQIGDQREYLYYSIIAPRKWFKLKPVTEDEYKEYYRLPGEIPDADGPGQGAGKAAGKAAGHGGSADPHGDADGGSGAEGGSGAGGRHAGDSNPGYAREPKLRRPRGVIIGEDTGKAPAQADHGAINI